jgi:predicted glycoside hydrolase/deacetylase ChbG (UPF0249 family)
VFARAFEKKLAKARLLFPDHFYGLSETGFLHTRGILGIVGALPEGVSELMCHPGYLDDDLVNAGTRLLAQREAEMRALTAPTVKTLVAERGIQLVSYRELGTNAAEATPVLQRVTTGSAATLRELNEQGALYDE